MLERICRWDGVCFNQGDIRRRIDYPCWPHCGRATSSIETGLEQRRMSIHVDTHVYTQIHRLQGLSIVRSGGGREGASNVWTHFGAPSRRFLRRSSKTRGCVAVGAATRTSRRCGSRVSEVADVGVVCRRLPMWELCVGGLHGVEMLKRCVHIL